MPKAAFSVGTDDLEDIAAALKSEEDGSKIKRRLSTQLRKAVAPAVTLAKSTIMAMDSDGSSWRKGGEPLRTAIAQAVKTQTRYASRSAGVRVRVSNKGMPRGFKWAARRTNRAKGWRHPVFAHRDEDGSTAPETWVHQTGKVGWFDDSMRDSAGEALVAVQRVVTDTAAKIHK
jgi:sarcosine oxidase delta subunit